ncbi:small GTP-binding domain protein [[Clostridium] bifermentans ATCC 638]|uniref:Small GTP-binding domain protein n=1 Tax=Paraclostridium bifermentans ATCC 638 = DSM 14991 TaxID=1233171 RepID=T4VRT8_PARBF|nr:small GTP-binding domain protein [[Clostridium] bifermentans ATCC 638] [Paraclostridium bifermentans ATCC 638 = DSM 14991]
MGNLNNCIEEARCTFIESPVRNYLMKEKDVPFKKIIKHNLEEVMNNFDILLEKPYSQLKLAIMGEVKSGKSTLVNAIVGREVSEVDVLEATSSIINIFYNEEETYDIDQNCINIGINSDVLKDISIVDTPGLKSITSENENKSIKYIQNADIILYVFDSTHIGQEDIKDVVELIASYGKPIVGVLNKGDLLHDNHQEVLEYIEDEYDLYIDKFFIISSHLEYQNNIIKNAVAKEHDLVSEYSDELKRNFVSLIEFLKSIRTSNDEIKLQSVNSSIEALKHKEKVYHYEYLKSLEMLSQELSNHKNLLNGKFDYIQAKMEFEINEWLDKSFLEDEIHRINKNMDIAREYINDNYINNVINNEKVKLDELFFKEWNECIKEVNSMTNNKIKEFIKDINYRDYNIDLPKVKLNEEEIDMNEMLATIGTGALLGATSGSALAVYAAALSASAPSVTIGAAMLTYCPPLLLAGTVTGGIGKVLYDKLKQDQMNKDIIEDIESFKDNIKFEIRNILIDIYEKASKEIIRIDQGIFENSKDVCMNEYEIEEFQVDLKEYIDKL